MAGDDPIDVAGLSGLLLVVLGDGGLRRVGLVGPDEDDDGPSEAAAGDALAEDAGRRLGDGDDAIDAVYAATKEALGL